MSIIIFAFITYFLTIFFVEVIRPAWLDFKPFSCNFCMNFWISAGLTFIKYFQDLSKNTLTSDLQFMINLLAIAGVGTFLLALSGYRYVK